MQRGLHPLGWQVRIAQLMLILTHISEVRGREVAAGLSLDLARSAVFQTRHRASAIKHPETLQALRDVLADLTDSDLRGGVTALIEGDVISTLECYGRFAARADAIPEPLCRLVENGAQAGHPLWHVANPYFALWSDITRVVDAQNQWQKNRAVAAATDPEAKVAGYQDWLASDVPARAHLLDLVARLGPRSTRFLDVGCGFGEWLRFLAEQGGVPIENLHGVDLHPGRVEATRRQLVEAAMLGAPCHGDPAAIAGRRIRHQDLLQFQPGANPDFHGVDVITLFVVTGCFDDGQLDQLLERLAALSPRYIFTTTVTSQWQMWRGRLNEGEFFARHGFQETERHWLPERLSLDPLSALVLPRRYWTNLSVRLYQPF
jgi:SAM-dependent methyltransferase